MKRILLFTLFSFAATVVIKAQSKGNIKVYAYRQSVLSGKTPEVILNEDGTTETRKTAAENYWIYTSSSSRIYPTEIWIKGKQYRIHTEPITRLPVTYTTQDGKEKILVPKSNNKILRIVPKEGTPEKKLNKGRTLAVDNEVVILYSLHGKYYYEAIKKFTSLPAQAMQ
jgi:hypothetical protein